MKKTLLALQFWEGDKQAANKVARLVADLQSKHSDEADFLFSARFDSQPDEATAAYVSRKFNTFTFINRHRRGQGWPFGCNELFFGTADYIYTQMLADKMPHYESILFFEADGCPLVPDWIGHLRNEWSRLRAKGAHLIGAMIPPGPPETGGLHINGNCLIDGDLAFLHWLARKVGGCAPGGGWDWLLAPQFKRQGWADCPRVKSFWHAPTMPDVFFNNLLAQGVVFAHGVKDDSVINLVRQKFLGLTRLTS